MAYLFDTDAISETLRKKPAADYIQWLRTIPTEQQYTSTIVIGELYKGAFRLIAQPQLLQKITDRVLPALVVLPFDVNTAKIYGQIHAELEQRGQILAHADLQIAATAIQHGLELVTGNMRHFSRVPSLIINPVLSNARSSK